MRPNHLVPIMLELLAGAGCATSQKDASAHPTSAATSISSSEPSSAANVPTTELSSEVPPTPSEENDIVNQIERNWNLGSLAGSPDIAGKVVELRLDLLPDGTVAKVEALNQQSGDPILRQLTDAAIRAVMISSPLKFPPGKIYDSITVRFHPDRIP